MRACVCASMRVIRGGMTHSLCSLAHMRRRQVCCRDVGQCVAGLRRRAEAHVQIPRGRGFQQVPHGDGADALHVPPAVERSRVEHVYDSSGILHHEAQLGVRNGACDVAGDQQYPPFRAAYAGEDRAGLVGTRVWARTCTHTHTHRSRAIRK